MPFSAPAGKDFRAYRLRQSERSVNRFLFPLKASIPHITIIGLKTFVLCSSELAVQAREVEKPSALLRRAQMVAIDRPGKIFAQVPVPIRRGLNITHARQNPGSFLYGTTPERHPPREVKFGIPPRRNSTCQRSCKTRYIIHRTIRSDQNMNLARQQVPGIDAHLMCR